MKTQFKGVEALKRRSVKALGAAAALVLSLSLASAATNDLTSILQKGLFEEEANHNLGEAIQLYQSVISRFDSDRKLAATAAFRLAECYRKQGKTNEASVQYDRVLREFPDQPQLAALSRQNLAALGASPAAPATATISNSARQEQKKLLEQEIDLVRKKLAAQQKQLEVGAANPDELLTTQRELLQLQRQIAALDAGAGIGPAGPNTAAQEAVQARAEAAALKTKIDMLSKMNGEELRLAIQQEYPNPVLTSLMQKLADSEQNLAAMQKEYGSNHAKVVEETTRIKTIESQIAAQVRAVANGLEAKQKEAEARAEVLAQSSAAFQGQQEIGAQPSTSAEAEEIRRIQAMIKDSPDLINARPDKGLAPLNEAAAQGHLLVAQFLVEHGADPEVKNPSDQWTPIHFAAFNGHKAIVELLLNHKVPVNAKEHFGKTPLHLAAEKGFRSVVEVLLSRGADVNATDGNGATPLHFAVGNGFRAVAELLLAKGADPNITAGNVYVAQHNTSGTALHVAVDRGDQALVELLVAHKAAPNIPNSSGLTPLDIAASAGKTQLAEFLISHGAEVNAKNETSSQQGWTALHYAVVRNQTEMIDLLLRHQADPNARMEIGSFGGPVPMNMPEAYGYTPLLIACTEGYSNAVAALLEAKADPNLRAGKAGGDLPIFSTMDHVSPPTRAGIVSLLLQHGANLDARNTGGNTPVLEAAAKKDMDSLKLLLAAKADPNAKSLQTGQTALHYLAMWAYSTQGSINLLPAMAKDLIAAGADVNVQDHNGRTPLNIINDWLSRPGMLQVNFATPLATPPGATGLPRSSKSSEPSYLETARAFADVLRKAGAVEDLARMDVIEVSRRSANFSQVVFSKGTNDYNHFTLYELIAAHYGFIAGSPQGFPNVQMDPLSHTISSGLKFPNLANVVIRRPKPDRTQWTTQTLNLTQLFQKDWNLGTYRTPCSDETLQWGDVVEISEADHPISAGWQGFPEKDLGVLEKCLSRQVQLTVKGSTTNMVLKPQAQIPGRFVTPNLEPIVPNFYLRSVLYRSGMLRASSDLSRVKVSRRDSASGQRYEMLFDCSANRPIDPSSELWLRDGDAIEVPEKAEP